MGTIAVIIQLFYNYYLTSSHNTLQHLTITK